jgi:hypothetical protein
MRRLIVATQGSVVVKENESERQVNQLDHSIGLSFDRQDSVYITNCSNNRIQKFSLGPGSIT